MTKLPVLSGSELVKMLGKVGWFPARQKGSHIILKNGKGKVVVIPNHKEVDPGTLLEIIRQVRLTREEFEKLM